MGVSTASWSEILCRVRISSRLGLFLLFSSIQYSFLVFLFFTSCSLSLNAGVLVSWDIWKHAICGLCGVYLPVDAYKYKISSFIMVKLIFKLPVSSETIDANRCIQNRDAREGIGKSDLE